MGDEPLKLAARERILRVRRERLAAELRANLKRRKNKAREAGDGEESADAGHAHERSRD